MKIPSTPAAPFLADLIHARVSPDFGALAGTGQLRRIVGALLTYGLIVAVLMLVACAATWALAAHSGGWQTAQRAKAGISITLAGAVLIGAAMVWTNWLLRLGAHL